MELFNAYQYMKLFHCSFEEYERRPHKETQWMLQIDSAYQKAVADVNERANNH